MDKNNTVSVGAGLRKRQQIRAANKTVFMWIISASVVIGICGVVSQFLIRQLMFNNKISDELSKTSSTLTKNIQAYDGLKGEVTKLVADENLTLLRKGPNGTALQVIIDALPTENNQAAFATSMQNEVLGPTGATISSFSVNEQQKTIAPTATQAGSFDFSFVISGSYAQIQQALRNMERSIRPMTVNTVDLQGSFSNMQASISATTYYQPVKDIQLKEEPVNP